MRFNPIVPIVYVAFTLHGCGSSQGPWMPDWNPEGKQDGIEGLTLFDELRFGEAVRGEFTEDHELHGWSLVASPGSLIALEITHKGSSTRVDTTLFLYGPQGTDGDWPADTLAWDDDSGWGKHAEIENVALAKGGKYVAVVATHDGQGRGHYRLELRCQAADDPGRCAAGSADSCLGRCGQYSQSTCSCNSACTRFGDCCPDHTVACDFLATDIHSSWLGWLKPEFVADTFIDLMTYLQQQYADCAVYPPREQVFNALIDSPLEEVKVVILGQDPYHGPGQAHGFSFSVPDGQNIPPSLRNIFKEIASDIAGIDPSSATFSYPGSGNLIPWADQGVLLLNTVLTVQESEPNSHKGQGWEPFTQRLIELISEKKDKVVFMLWGSKARAKASLIDDSRHLILEAAHPSPLTTGFRGCRHFSQANTYLEEHGQDPVDWYDSIW